MLRALAGPQGQDAVDFLGQIEQVEVDRERGGGGARGVHRELGHRQGQADRRVHLAGAAGLGERADLLLGLEERDGFLGAQDLAESFAQQVNGGREVQSGALPVARVRRSGALVERAVLHDHAERVAVLQDRDVGERVAVHEQEIGEGARLRRRPARRAAP